MEKNLTACKCTKILWFEVARFEETPPISTFNDKRRLLKSIRLRELNQNT